MPPDPNGERKNPYAAPELPPLRGYWSRFFPAMGRAIRQYRRDMRRQEIGLAAQLWAWFSLFGLLTILLAIITGGAILLYSTLVAI
jgi:hypothetical protein